MKEETFEIESAMKEDGYRGGYRWFNRADAEFIVCAVNSHETLISALHEALAHCQLLGSGETPLVSNSEMCEIIGKAIAQASDDRTSQIKDATEGRR